MANSLAKSPRSLAIFPLTPTVDKYRAQLSARGEHDPLDVVGSHSALIPMRALDAAVKELREALAPAEPAYVRICVVSMISAYPQRGGPDRIDGYLAAMAEDLASFPPDVVQAACTDARRTIKFMPAIAEVREIAQRVVYQRRKMLDRAGEMLREHRRRQRAAEEEAGKERHRHELVARAEAVLDRKFGIGTPARGAHGDYERATTLVLRRLGAVRWGRWHAELEAGAPWAMSICRQLGIVARARELSGGPAAERRLDSNQALAIIRMVGSDETGARRLLAEAAARRIIPSNHPDVISEAAFLEHVGDIVTKASKAAPSAALTDDLQLARSLSCAFGRLHRRKSSSS